MRGLSIPAKLAGAVAFVLCLMTAAQAERRVALVIGNDRYLNLQALQKAGADARTYADLLKSQGFDEVILKTDLTRSQMDEAVAIFLDRIAPGDTAVFAYSGHGWSDGVQNFIIGVDAPAAGSQEFLARISMPLKNGVSGVLDDMSRRGAGLKVAIVDACRDNPFTPASGGRNIGLGRGLARVDPPRGTFVVFSAATGQTALDRLSDRDGDPNSVFTRIFVPLVRSGLSLQDATKEAQARVMTLARTVDHDQQPAYYDEVVGRACLSGNCGGPPRADTPPPPPTVQSAEIVFWNSIVSSTNPADFDAYLRQFPAGSFALLARIRLAALTPPTPPAPPVAPPPPRLGLPDPLLSNDPTPGSCLGGLIASVGNAGVTIAAKRCLKAKDAFKDCTNCPEMVMVPAGSFTMGSPATEVDRDKDEGPQHTVGIGAPFAVGRFEITRGQFATFVREANYKPVSSCLTRESGKLEDTAGRSFSNPGFRQEDSHPVVCISWNDAKAYAAWLARTTGRPYRLLSEAEWEYAARAGTTTAFPTGNEPDRLCVNRSGTGTAGCKDTFEFTAPVGSFPANDFGLQDMLGNASEWVEDCWIDNYNDGPKDAAPRSAASCSHHIVRGGTYDSGAKFLRSAVRNLDDGKIGALYLGLRVARALGP